MYKKCYSLLCAIGSDMKPSGVWTYFLQTNTHLLFLFVKKKRCTAKTLRVYSAAQRKNKRKWFNLRERYTELPLAIIWMKNPRRKSWAIFCLWNILQRVQQKTVQQAKGERCVPSILITVWYYRKKNRIANYVNVCCWKTMIYSFQSN